MKLLPAPFGADAGYSAHLQLTVNPGGFDAEAAKQVMAEYGCAPQFAERAVGMLRNSRRYDCYLQQSWVRNSYEDAVHDFEAIGLRFFINEWVGGSKHPS